MKKLILLLLLLPAIAFADTGYFIRSDCSTISSPAANATACLQTTSAGGRTAGQVYVWNGSAWTAAGLTGPQGPAGAAGNPAGSNTQLQYNNSASFGGISGATSDGTSVTFGDDNIKVGITQCTNKAAPSTPAAGKTEIYCDSTSKNIAAKNDAGTVNHGVQTKAAVASNFVTAIADDGTVTVAQPSGSDLSLSDVTTNDVSITKHGFAPKLPNDATKFLNGVGAYSVPAGGGGTSADVQIFTNPALNPQTWTKPAGSPKFTCAYEVGGGAGGGSGRRGAAGTTRSGGSGGAPGGVSDRCWPTSILGATETVNVGAKGTGGAAQTSDSTSGNNGNNGGDTIFGSWLKASGGTGGSGGIAGSPLSGGAAGKGIFTGQQGGNGTGTVGGAPNASTTAPGAGAGGSGLDTSNTARNGAAGGNGSDNFHSLAGGSAGSSCGVGGNGTDATTNEPIGGGGGGSGSSCTGAATGAGGNGGKYGGGGGGGAASENSFASGKGGDGADGILIVVTYF